MKIYELAQDSLNGLVTELIDVNQAEKFVIDAAREYQAWGFLKADNADFDDLNEWCYQPTEIDRETDLTLSEWGVISPLAKLFAERENALIQESSRVVSHEVYGRSSSEINQEIHNYRNEYLRKWAFTMPIVSV